jgi:hypothetical protein
MKSDHHEPTEDAGEVSPEVLAAWWQRAQEFRILLAGMDRHVCFQLGPDDDNVYILAHREDDGLLLEAVSNAYLAKHIALSVDEECGLLELGWEPPHQTTPNFFRFYDNPVDLAVVARDVVVTFLQAYGASPEADFYVLPGSLIGLLGTGAGSGSPSEGSEGLGHTTRGGRADNGLSPQSP